MGVSRLQSLGLSRGMDREGTKVISAGVAFLILGMAVRWNRICGAVTCCLNHRRQFQYHAVVFFFPTFFVASYSFKELGPCVTALILGCMLALSIS